MAEVKIISEEQISQYRAGGEVVVVMAVTYALGERPPRTVWIDKAKYNDRALQEAIRADVAAATEQAPRTIEI